MNPLISYTILRRVMNILRDIVWACLYLKTSDMPRKKSKVQRCIGSILLMSLFFLYTAEDGGIMTSAWIRLFWRTGCCFLFLLLTRQISLLMALFDSLVYSVGIIISHNFLLTPATRPLLLLTAPILADPLWNHVVCFAISFLFPCLVFLTIQKWMPLRIVQSVGLL